MELPKHLPPLPAGYTYLGLGNTFKTNGQFPAMIFGSYQSAKGWRRLYGDGSAASWHYATNDLNLIAMNKVAPTLEQEIEIAKSFIGKRVTNSSGSIGNITDIAVFVTESSWKQWQNRKSGVEPTVFPQHLVYVTGTWGKGSADLSLCISLGPDHKYYPQLVKSVIVNGYEGVDKGHYYEFGCAKITKEALLKAKAFLESCPWKDESEFKQVQSVKIGAGEFTLDILKQMTL